MRAEFIFLLIQCLVDGLQYGSTRYGSTSSVLLDAGNSISFLAKAGENVLAKAREHGLAKAVENAERKAGMLNLKKDVSNLGNDFLNLQSKTASIENDVPNMRGYPRNDVIGNDVIENTMDQSTTFQNSSYNGSAVYKPAVFLRNNVILRSNLSTVNVTVPDQILRGNNRFLGLLFCILLCIFLFGVWLWHQYVKVGRTRFDQRDVQERILTEVWSTDAYETSMAHQKGVNYLHEIFERSARKYPTAPCFRMAEGMTTFAFREMDSKAEKIKSLLQERVFTNSSNKDKIRFPPTPEEAYEAMVNSRPSVIVAVLLERNSEVPFVSHLGVLKSGAALLTLDHKLPTKQLQYMVEDAKPVCILCGTVESVGSFSITDGNNSGSIGNSISDATRLETVQAIFPDTEVIDVVAFLDGNEKGQSKDDPNGDSYGNYWKFKRKSEEVVTQRLFSVPPEEHPALIIYTSGSTGKPKAVVSSHAAYVNSLGWSSDLWALQFGVDIGGQTASLSYDACLDEIYIPWMQGCPVVCLVDDQVRSGPDLIPIFQKEKITMICIVPSLLPTITDNPDRDLPYPLLSKLYVGGEALSEDLVPIWTTGGRRLINGYGPTEAAIVCVAKEIVDKNLGGIGTPFGDLSAFIMPIVDDDSVTDRVVEETVLSAVDDGQGFKKTDFLSPFSKLEPLPFGEAGELCVNGIQIAHGYLNQPNLTAEKFINHPKLGRFYRTGDLCFIHPERKDIVYNGRIDQQVKIRGHRIELQAVEKGIMQCVEQAKESSSRESCTPESVFGSSLGSSLQILLSKVTITVAAKQGDSLVVYLVAPEEFTKKEKDSTKDANYHANASSIHVEKMTDDHDTISIHKDAAGVEFSLKMLSVDLLREMKNKLRSFLSTAAIPSDIGILSDIPRLAASVKINRKALPSLEPRFELLPPNSNGPSGRNGIDVSGRSGRNSSRPQQESVASLTPAELAVLCTAQEGISNMTFDSDFVYDLGLDSIRIAKLALALKRQLPTVSVRMLLQSRSLRKVCKAIELKVGGKSDQENTCMTEISTGMGAVTSLNEGLIINPGDYNTTTTSEESEENSEDGSTGGFLTKESQIAQERKEKRDLKLRKKEELLSKRTREAQLSKSMGPEAFSSYQGITLMCNYFYVTLFLAFSTAGMLYCNELLIDKSVITRLTLLTTSFFLCSVLPVCIQLWFAQKLLHWMLPLPENSATFEKFSSYHYRLWLRERLNVMWIRLIGLLNVADSSWILKLGLQVFGAEIGDDVVFVNFNEYFRGDLSQVKIGDRSILQYTTVQTYTYERTGKNIVTGPVIIESDVKLGIRTYIGPNTHIQERAELEPLSAVGGGAIASTTTGGGTNKGVSVTSQTLTQRTPTTFIGTSASNYSSNHFDSYMSTTVVVLVPAGEIWDGVPATFTGRKRAIMERQEGVQCDAQSNVITNPLISIFGNLSDFFCNCMDMAVILSSFVYFSILYAWIGMVGAYKVHQSIVLPLIPVYAEFLTKHKGLLGPGGYLGEYYVSKSEAVTTLSILTMLILLDLFLAIARNIDPVLRAMICRFMMPKLQPGSFEKNSFYGRMIVYKTKLLMGIQSVAAMKANLPYILQLAGIKFEKSGEGKVNVRSTNVERFTNATQNENSALSALRVHTGKPIQKTPYPYHLGCACNELDILHGLVPDITLVGTNSFWAGGGISGQCSYENVAYVEKSSRSPKKGKKSFVTKKNRVCLQLQRSRMPQNYFIGNGAVTMPGNHATNLLVGVSTMDKGNIVRRMNSRLDGSITIFGKPALTIGSDRSAFKNAETTCDSESQDYEARSYELTRSYEPTLGEFLYRYFMFDVFVDIFIYIPLVVGIVLIKQVFLGMSEFLSAMEPHYMEPGMKVGPESNHSGVLVAHGGGVNFPFSEVLVFYFIFFSYLGVLFSLGNFFFWVFLKRLLMGNNVRGEQIGEHGDTSAKHLSQSNSFRGAYSLWDRRVKSHFFLWELTNVYVTPLLAIFDGTLFANSFYRTLGVKIGERSLFTVPLKTCDFDNIHVGKDCVIGDVHFQIHTFEDRVFWTDVCHIQDGAVCQSNTTIMGGSTIGRNTCLNSGCVVMKTETLEDGKVYQGSPAEVVEWK